MYILYVKCLPSMSVTVPVVGGFDFPFMFSCLRVHVLCSLLACLPLCSLIKTFNFTVMFVHDCSSGPSPSHLLLCLPGQSRLDSIS